jgi:choline dehydrogenase-like flavoprotein
LGKIEDTNIVVRANAVGMLAWLAEPKADSVLREHYWREADPEIRQNIVMSIDAFCPDLDTAVSFLKQAAVKDTLTAIAEEIRTSLEVMAGARQQLDSLKRVKNPSSEDFQKQYDRIYESAGSEGDYDVLLISSTIADEPRLKTLRERVLQRNSDECFYDYHKINKIIVRNRLLYR